MRRPTFQHRLALGFKALRQMVFPRWGGGLNGNWGWPFSGLFGTLPGSNIDLNEIGNPEDNSAVAICLNWIADQFDEPDFEVVQQGTDGKLTPIIGHPLAELINTPNPFYGSDVLFAASIVSYCVGGEVFWIRAKGMAGYGRTRELWYAPHWQVRPRWNPEDKSSFIDYYELCVDGKWERYELDEVIHFFDRLDMNTRRGISRLRPALRSVGADNQADAFCYAILKNMGVPAVVMSPKDPKVPIDKQARAALREAWLEQTTGDKRGMPLVPSVAMDLQFASLSPEQLALDKIRDVPEDRIAASLRLNPMVVGLTSGAKHKTYANYEEANKAAYRDCVLPLQKKFARTINRKLLPEFGDPQRQQARWNYDNVWVMRPDLDAISERARGEYQDGVITRNEARADIGKPPVDGGDTFAPPRRPVVTTRNPKDSQNADANPALA